MNLPVTIAKLKHMRDQLSVSITSLEELEQSRTSHGGELKPGKRRGRKSMPVAERKIVSERIRNYWAARRAAKQQEQV